MSAEAIDVNTILTLSLFKTLINRLGKELQTEFINEYFPSN